MNSLGMKISQLLLVLFFATLDRSQSFMHPRFGFSIKNSGLQSSSLDEATTRELKSNTPTIATVNPNPNGVSLHVFIVDCSFLGGTKRIQAVQGAVVGLLSDRDERRHVSVVTCNHKHAEIILEPTSSLLKANRGLNNMRKSVMGDMNQGLLVALKQAERSVLDGIAREITLIMVSHSKTHSFNSWTSSCDVEQVEEGPLCDADLQESVTELLKRTEQLARQGITVRSIMIDTDNNSLSDDGKIPEGVRLAAACNAKYFRSRELSDEEILSFINTAKKD